MLLSFFLFLEDIIQSYHFLVSTINSKKVFSMKKSIIVIVICLIALHADGQERKFALRGFISPGIGQLSTQNRIFEDGKETLTNMTKSSGLFFGGSVQILRKLENNWLLGGDLGFISKGYFATMDSTYNFGSLAGTGFERTDLNFLETTLSIEKQVLLKNSDYSLLFSSGVFYGIHIPKIVGFGLEANGNDFGTSLSIGIQRKRCLAKFEYKKGLTNISNNINSSFRTNILSLKIGYQIL